MQLAIFPSFLGSQSPPPQLNISINKTLHTCTLKKMDGQARRGIFTGGLHCKWDMQAGMNKSLRTWLPRQLNFLS
jgi:hypothetical protein